MIDILVKALIAIGAAAVTYIIADQITLKVTNRRLHEHLEEKYKSFTDGIRAWCESHATEIEKAKIFLRLRADDIRVGTRRIGKKLTAFARKSDGTTKPITTEQILTEEEIRALGLNPNATEDQEMEYMET
ncbi:MAG: hypothetical protein LBM92_00065 [Opitutaceae bacterium]|jgi:hypothetical protein|nr:hypothetical protein [Opitutaceae bacterium]